MPPLHTPDGRYLIVRGRLWRATNPHLPADTREQLVAELMNARHDKQRATRAGDTAAREAARHRVNQAKIALGERGPVWWHDGAPDLNRHLARNTPYASWFATLPESATTQAAQKAKPKEGKNRRGTTSVVPKRARRRRLPLCRRPE